jgi:H+/gluconate symporter-like permease
MDALGIIGIVVAIALFIILVYKQWSVFWASALCAIVVAVTNGFFDSAVIAETYVGGITELILSLFVMVFFGAIIGKIYLDSGAGASLAGFLMKVTKLEGKSPKTKAWLGLGAFVFLACILQVGGIDGYVLVFMTAPIAVMIAKAANIPDRFLPGMLFTNVAFMCAPGVPQIYNVMLVGALKSQGFYEVNSWVGAVPGWIAVAIVTIGIYVTLGTFITRAIAKGEGYEGARVKELETSALRDSKPPVILTVLPILTVVVLYTILGYDVSLALPAALIVAIIALFKWIKPDFKNDENSIAAIKAKRFGRGLGKGVVRAMNEGSAQMPGAIMGICAPAGFAAVVMMTPTFEGLVGLMFGINAPYVYLALVLAALVTGITASPPTAIFVAIPTVIGILTAQGMAADFNPAVARAVTFAACTFESLPYGGYLIFVFSRFKASYKESYKYAVIKIVWCAVGAIVCGTLILAGL